MSIGFRKILRDLWRSKGRTLLAVLSIFIGVFATGTISGLRDLLPAQMWSSYSATNPAHIIISLNGAVSADDINNLARLPGVAGLEGSTGFGAQWRLTPNAPWRSAAIEMRDYEHQQFNTLDLLSGAWPARDTVAVDITAVDSYGLPAQGTFTLRINDRDRVIKIGGVVRDLTVTSPAFGGKATFYISQDMAENLFGWRRHSTLRAQIPEFSTQAAEDVVDQVKTQIEKMGASIFYYQIFPPNKHPTQDILNGIIMILSVMAILALILGLFLVINTVNAVVAQQVPQIGVLKAIGGTTGQLLLLYLSSVLIYGLIALLLAAPLAALAAQAATRGLLQLLAIPTDSAFHVSQAALIQQVIIAVCVPLLAALWPVFSGVRITVRQAISNYGIGGSFGKGLLDRLLSRLRFLPRTVSLTIRNTFRRKGRVVLTEITLVMAGVVFIMVTSSGASFTYTVNYLTDTLGLRVLINFQRPYRSAEIVNIIEAQPHIDRSEMQLFQTSTLFTQAEADKGDDVFISAVRPESKLLKLPVTSGRWLVPADGHAVVLNRDRAEEWGVNIGDTIWTGTGDKHDRTAWTVVGTVFDLSSQRTIYVPLNVYQQESGLVGRSTSAWVATLPDDDVTQLQMEKTLRDAFDARGLRVGGTQTQAQIRSDTESKFSIISKMLMFMSVLIAAVGAIGLAGTLSINVLERRREIGVLRAIGASSITIAGLFIGEGLLLGLIAWVIAIPLSIPVGQAFSAVIGQVIKFDVIYQFSWNGALTWLIIIVALSVLGSLLPAIRATRVSVRESLAYE
ncbi:MAG TPA: FtsX-like permease family protein [Anaerolineae bacterium]|nr:FtsX-like permease family protein [Anaerolineae bacterium]